MLDWRTGTRREDKEPHQDKVCEDDVIKRKLAGMHLQDGDPPPPQDTVAERTDSSSAAAGSDNAPGMPDDDSKEMGKDGSKPGSGGGESALPWLVKWCGQVVLDEEVESSTTRYKL